MAYEAATGNLVIVPGFVDHPTIPMCGGSPDGLVDDDGIIEMKAPTSKTHIETLLSEECEHLPQIMGNLACTQRKWCDFVSYDPRLPKHLQLYIRRVFADGKYIETLESGVMVFLNETAELMARLNETAPGQSAETATPATDDSSREAAASEAALHHEMKHAIVRAPSGQSERQGCRREAS
jgi:hypothetical protein